MATPELKFPFARELKEQHDALRATVRWFRSEVEQGRSNGSGGPVGDAFLRLFHEQLVKHFRFEELHGFEGGSGSNDPEIQGWTLELFRQHHDLEERLGALIARLEESGSVREIPAPLLTELDAFFAALRQHDAEENALLSWISRGPADFARDTEEP